LRGAWLLVLPFLVFSRPTAALFLAGGLISLLGLLLRAVAAGSILKDERLASGGVYGRLRHPLYVGSFLLGLGLSVAGGRWWFPLAFAALFGWIYFLTIRAEVRELESRFGECFQSYRAQVPAFLPRLRPYRSGDPSQGFRLEVYLRNKEWQAALGALVGYAVLWARMILLG
jgi:protein-S-isoprenylcysteine O-methyltransferase Ste14